MGTEVAISFSALRAQLENERSSLFKIDENIRKIHVTPRFPSDRFNSGAGDYSRSSTRASGRTSFTDNNGNNFKNDESLVKRRHETKTVFSRLSARAPDSDGEEDGPGNKRSRMPSAVSRELPTRAAVLRAQGGDEQARTRNRRIFGSLLGTLQKFKQEEIVLQTKEEKKAQVERKIEEQARLQKEKEQKERKSLFAERENKKATIKALEAKMARVQEFEKWETSQKSLGNFILTKAKPHIYWLPKRMTEKASERLNTSRKYHERCLSNKRHELQEELQRIEQRCLRSRAPAKENEPHIKTEEETEHKQTDNAVEDVKMEEEEDKGSKRNKFAVDTDDKEDSDADDRHDDLPEDDQKIEAKEEQESNKNNIETCTAENADVDITMTTEKSNESTEAISETNDATTTQEEQDNNTVEEKQDTTEPSQHS
ncbi:hypothetical protein ACJJTC_005287 [Scirpophaga incertulas]